jgi:hypothetical protein
METLNVSRDLSSPESSSIPVNIRVIGEVLNLAILEIMKGDKSTRGGVEIISRYSGIEWKILDKSSSHL